LSHALNHGAKRHVEARFDARVPSASRRISMRILLCFALAGWVSSCAAQAPGSQAADSSADGSTPAAVDATASASTESSRNLADSAAVPPPPTIDAPPSPVESFTFGEAAPAGLGDALWARDRDAALAAIEASPTISRAVACVEAVLRELALVAEYLPRDPPVDRLSARLFDDTRARVIRAFERDLRAHRRCLAAALTHDSMHSVGPSGPTEVALQDELAAIARREAELASLASGVSSADPLQVHAALAQALGVELGIELDSSVSDDRAGAGDRRDTHDVSHAWDVASAFYVSGHGRLPTPDERKLEPSWRLTPLLVGAMELVLGLALIPATAGASGGPLDDARVRLGLVGLAVGGVVSLILFPTWLERDRRARLLAGGLVVLASIGLGLGTALADVRPRLRAFGVTLATTSVVDVAFWIGGAVIQRRWRPTAAVSRHHAVLGGTYVF
jgi:hypothetical protein